MTLLFVNEYKAKYTTEKSLETNSYPGGAMNERTRRPRNAFILYRQEKQKSSKKSNLPSKEISKIIAQMWKSESEDVRRRYERLAEVEKLNHIVTYPQYKYAPRQRRKSPLPARTQEPTGINEGFNPSIDRSQSNTFIPSEVASIYRGDGVHDSFVEGQANILVNNSSYIDQDCILTLPSEILDDSQILPDSTELDLMSIKDYELYTLLSVMSKF